MIWPLRLRLTPPEFKSSLCRFGRCDETEPPLSYVSFFRVGAQLALQAERQPLVRVVQHQAHQLHPLLDLRTHVGSHRKVRLNKQRSVAACHR